MQTYIRVAKSDPPGVHTFYVSSFTVVPEFGTTMEPVEYAVKHIRTGRGGRFWSCTCPNYVHRMQAECHYCKHIKLVKSFVECIGGLRKIPRGDKVDIGEPEPVDVNVNVGGPYGEA